MTRKEAIENIRKHFDYMQEWITPKEVLKVALEALKQPEIVRCNYCKYGNLWSEENVIVCDKLSKTRNKNWFCADGERRTDDA